jgi:hypothetical protein
LLVRFITRGEFIPKSSLISGYDPLQAFQPCKKLLNAPNKMTGSGG